jgi:hypothetical protein
MFESRPYSFSSEFVHVSLPVNFHIGHSHVLSPPAEVYVGLQPMEQTCRR